MVNEDIGNLKSGDISKLLDIISTHQKPKPKKDVGGGGNSYGVGGSGNPFIDFIKQAGGNPTTMLGNILNNPTTRQMVSDTGAFLGDTNKAWANALSQVIPALQGKKIQGSPQMSDAAQRGQNIVTGGIMGAPSDIPAPDIAGMSTVGSDAIDSGAQKVVQGANDVKAGMEAAPGGMQAGFVRVAPEDAASTANATATDAANTDAATTVNPKGRTYAPGHPQDDPLENIKRNLQLTSDSNGIQTPKDQAQVNATLNGYGIKGNMNDQLQGIADQKGILTNAAQKQIAQDGGTTTKDELLSGMTHDVAYNGSKHTIDAPNIEPESRKYLNSVYVRATNGDPTKLFGDVMPESVPDTVVQKMKSLMNEDAASTFGKDPTTWTKEQQIARYGRNSFDKILDTKHPEASILNNDTSDLYKAQESIMDGANKENNAAQSAALTPKQSPAQKFMGAIGRHPFLTTGALATGVPAGIAGGYAGVLQLFPGKNYKTQTGDISIPSLSKVTDSTGSNLALTLANHNQGIQAINDQENAILTKEQDPTYRKGLALGLPDALSQKQLYDSQKSVLENQRNTIENQFRTTAPIVEQYTQTQNILDDLKAAKDELNQAKPSWFSAWGPLGAQLTQIRAATVPGYGQFAARLQALKDKYGIDPRLIAGASNAKDAEAIIDETMKSYEQRLRRTVQNAGGSYGDEDKKATGKDILQSQLNQVQTGNQTLNGILNAGQTTPTPTTTPTPPQASPTPDSFQQQLTAPFRPGSL